MTGAQRIRTLAFLLTPLAAMTLTACGGSTSSSTSNSASSPVASTATARTPANERGLPAKSSPSAHASRRSGTSPSIESSLPVSVPASRADTEAVTKLVETYNAAVASDNGAKGCELLSTKERQSLTEGTSRKTCAEFITSTCRRAAGEKFVSPTVKLISVIRSRKSPGTHTDEGPSVSFSVSTAAGVTIRAQDQLEREHGVWRLDSNGGRSWATAGVSQSSRSKIIGLAGVCL